MEMYSEILAGILARDNIHVTFPDVKVNPTEIVLQPCYQALQAIREILKKSTLTDEACFEKMEDVLDVFTAMNVNTDPRHMP